MKIPRKVIINSSLKTRGGVNICRNNNSNPHVIQSQCSSIPMKINYPKLVSEESDAAFYRDGEVYEVGVQFGRLGAH